MTAFLNDLRYALRQLRKSPGFAALAICTLAIGIGASTAIYSIVDGVLLRSLPYQDPQRLVSVFESFPALGFDQAPFGAPDYTFVAGHNRSFSGIAAYRDQDYELTGAGVPIRVDGERVSASMFSVLGVAPQLGRTFTQQEDTSGAPVVVLNHAFWRKQFASDPHIVGRTIDLDRQPYTVIGVMPCSLVFPNHGEKFNNTPAAIYTPMHFSPQQLQTLGNQFNYSAIARLKPGVSIQQASSEVNGLIDRFSQQYPPIMRSNPLFHLGGSATSYNDQVVGDVRSRLLLLQLSVLLVLLIACVDVANLLLARATGRQRELALRIAVGAQRSRIVAQLLSESLLLAMGGGLLGLPLAYGAMRLLLSAAPVDLPRAGSIALSAGVLAFCFSICLLTALLTGLIPALRALRVNPNESLYEGGRSGTAGRGRHRILSMLVTAQFALAMVLLVTAGLVLRSFQQLLATDPGFRPDHVITMRTTLPLAAYSTQDQIENFYRNLLDRVAPLPGVRQAALSTSLPIHIGEHDIVFIEGTPSRPATSASIAQNWIAGAFFPAQGIRLLRGRFFTPQDRNGSQLVAIVSDGFAKKYFSGEDPVGRRIRQGESPKHPWMTIVGVVEDVKSKGLDQPADLETYTPYFQNESVLSFTDPNIDEMRSLYLNVRTQQDPASMRNLLIATIHSIDASLPVTDVHTMTEKVHTSLAPERFNSFILGVFAVLALLLAAAGIGGVLAYTVHQRTREIGVRMALGAQRGDVSRLVLMEGMKLAGLGVAIGGLLSLFTGRLLAAQLYQVTAHDPATFATGLGVLFAIALGACWIPARRAASIDPMHALRTE